MSLISSDFEALASIFPLGFRDGNYVRTGHYQGFLELVAHGLKPKVVVETGVEYGVSSSCWLRALDEIGGDLHSVDPAPLVSSANANWTIWKEVSKDALPKIADLFPVWDIFLHDSDHGYENQDFEYNFAWNMLRKGGILISDDYTWEEHGAWSEFIQDRDWYTIGNASLAIK